MDCWDLAHGSQEREQSEGRFEEIQEHLEWRRGCKREGVKGEGGEDGEGSVKGRGGDMEEKGEGRKEGGGEEDKGGENREKG